VSIVLPVQRRSAKATGGATGGRPSDLRAGASLGQALPNPTTAFGDYVRALAEELEAFDRPVAYLHGDTHLFRIDKPLHSAKSGRLFENFTRVETFGWPDTHWVRTVVDPSDPALFKFSAEIVPDNVVNHRAK
jgi:hypothetical protein